MKLSVWAIALSTTVNCASCFALPPSEQIVTSKHVKAELPENTDLVRGVIKGDFEREVLADSYASTSTPCDSSFDFVSDATFVVFDPVRGRQILGPSPIFDFMFSLPNLTHEGPVYVPDTNELYFARVKPGFLPQLVVNLSAIPPTLSEKLADPPVYAGTGGRYENGEIIYATVSGDDSLGGNSFRPGLYALDVRSGKSRTLLNNYYGYYFSSLDDMDIDAQGQIWFTNNAMIIIDKHGPLYNAADRDHCLKYMLAVVLCKGDMIHTEDYQDASPWAQDPQIERLREKTTMVEDTQFTRDYHDPEIRSISNAIQVQLMDGTLLVEVTVKYPQGHVLHPETPGLVQAKAERNLALNFHTDKAETLVRLVTGKDFDAIPVHEFVDMLALKVVWEKAHDSSD